MKDISSIHLITLGVADLERSRDFYEAIGWRAAPESVPGGVVFLQGNGFVLSLYGVGALAADQEADGPLVPGGAITLGRNFADRAAMEAGLAAFLAAGGREVRAPFAAPWGTVAYAADPDGHVWEFAHVPGFEPDAAGNLVLSSARA